MGSDTSEVGKLYERHGEEVLNYLARHCPAGTAQDLLQETFLQVVRSADRLRAIETPRAWLFGIARNMLAGHYRRRQPTAEPMAGMPEKPAPETEEDHRLASMRQAIAKLPAELRETLELRLTDELSYEEIATVLIIPVGTVRSRLHNAVRRLRTELTHSQDLS